MESTARTTQLITECPDCGYVTIIDFGWISIADLKFPYETMSPFNIETSKSGKCKHCQLRESFPDESEDFIYG